MRAASSELRGRARECDGRRVLAGEMEVSRKVSRGVAQPLLSSLSHDGLRQPSVEQPSTRRLVKLMLDRMTQSLIEVQIQSKGFRSARGKTGWPKPDERSACCARRTKTPG
jgi:hypothetical protein